PPPSTARMSPGQSGMPGTGLSRRAGLVPGARNTPEQVTRAATKDPQPATCPARPITSSAAAKVLQHALCLSFHQIFELINLNFLYSLICVIFGGCDGVTR